MSNNRNPPYSFSSRYRPLSPRIDEIFASNRSAWNGIIRRGGSGRHVSMQIGLNWTLTKVSPQIFQKIASTRSRLCTLSLSFFFLHGTDRFSLFLSRLRPRARSQLRNRPAGKRECISRLLSFPSIFYRREKNTPTKVPSTYIICMYTCIYIYASRCACVVRVCRRVSSVSVMCDSPAHAVRCYTPEIYSSLPISYPGVTIDPPPPSQVEPITGAETESNPYRVPYRYATPLGDACARGRISLVENARARARRMSFSLLFTCAFCSFLSFHQPGSHMMGRSFVRRCVIRNRFLEPTARGTTWNVRSRGTFSRSPKIVERGSHSRSALLRHHRGERFRFQRHGGIGAHRGGTGRA